jgi:hypothetical protein
MHDRPSSNDCSPTNNCAGKNHYTCSNPHIIFNDDIATPPFLVYHGFSYLGSVIRCNNGNLVGNQNVATNSDSASRRSKVDLITDIRAISNGQ